MENFLIIIHINFVSQFSKIFYLFVINDYKYNINIVQYYDIIDTFKGVNSHIKTLEDLISTVRNK